VAGHHHRGPADPDAGLKRPYLRFDRLKSPRVRAFLSLKNPGGFVMDKRVFMGYNTVYSLAGQMVETFAKEFPASETLNIRNDNTGQTSFSGLFFSGSFH
jgi:hypothetical protein